MQQTNVKDRKELAFNNVYCIGRNYVQHAKELGNSVEEQPVVFLKTNSCITTDTTIYLPPKDFSADIHHEVELVLYIKEDTNYISSEAALNIVGGYTIGLDLTARDLQTILKQKSLPWTASKSFKNAGWVGDFITNPLPSEIMIELYNNGRLKQVGTSKQMIFTCEYIISYISEIYGLRKGDLIFTGTPAGVAAIQKGDQLRLVLDNQLSYELDIV